MIEIFLFLHHLLSTLICGWSQRLIVFICIIIGAIIFVPQIIFDVIFSAKRGTMRAPQISTVRSSSNEPTKPKTGNQQQRAPTDATAHSRDKGKWGCRCLIELCSILSIQLL